MATEFWLNNNGTLRSAKELWYNNNGVVVPITEVWGNDGAGNAVLTWSAKERVSAVMHSGYFNPSGNQKHWGYQAATTNTFGAISGYTGQGRYAYIPNIGIYVVMFKYFEISSNSNAFVFTLLGNTTNIPNIEVDMGNGIILSFTHPRYANATGAFPNRTSYNLDNANSSSLSEIGTLFKSITNRPTEITFVV